MSRGLAAAPIFESLGPAPQISLQSATGRLFWPSLAPQRQREVCVRAPHSARATHEVLSGPALATPCLYTRTRFCTHHGGCSMAAAGLRCVVIGFGRLRREGWLGDGRQAARCVRQEGVGGLAMRNFSWDRNDALTIIFGSCMRTSFMYLSSAVMSQFRVILRQHVGCRPVGRVGAPSMVCAFARAGLKGVSCREGPVA